MLDNEPAAGCFLDGELFARNSLRRPMVGCFLVYLTGLCLGLFLYVSLPVFFVLAGLSLVAAFIFWRIQVSGVFLFFALLCLGAVSGSMAIHDPASSALSDILHYDRTYLELEGIIDSDPVYSKSGSKEQKMTAVFSINLQGIRMHKDWQVAREKIRVYVRETDSGQTFEYGQRWIFTGLLKDLSRHAQPQRRYRLYTDGQHARLQEEPGAFNLWAACYQGRKACASILSLGIGEQSVTARLLRALILGYREELSYSLREMFSTTGTFHIFAISGLHVGIMVIMIIGVLKLFGLSRNHWILFVIPLLIVYTLGTGARASAIRAAIMVVVFWGGAFFYRRSDSYSALSAAALIILIFAPLQLRNPGFLMSFIVVGGIIVFTPKMLVPWYRWLAVDPLRLQPENRWMQWGRTALRGLGNLFFVSLAAWLVSLPVTAYYFNLFCPVSFLGNVAIVPGAFLVVFTGCLSLLTGFVFPWLAEVFNFANTVFVGILLQLVEWMQAVPGGHFFVKAPPGWMLILWYAGLLALFFGSLRVKRLIVILFVCLIFGGIFHYYTNENLHIDVLDTGQGNAAFVDLPQTKHDMLIDTGPARLGHRLIRHLRGAGVDRLGVLLLSHPDAEHIGAAETVLRSIPVRELWCPAPKIYHETVQQQRDFKLLQSILQLAHQKEIPVTFLSAGMSGFFGETQWDIFWPDADRRYRSANDGSVVMRIARDGGAALFMGGGKKRVENNIYDSMQNPSSPVLITGDHGARRTCSTRWLDRVAPDWVLISVGYYNTRGDPASGVLARLRQRNVNVWRTDRMGGVRILWTTPEAGHYRILPLNSK